MSPYLIAGAVLLAAVGSLVFSTLTYSLRELSRARLADYLERNDKSHLFEATVHHVDDLVFVTAVGRLLFNTSIVLASLWLCQQVFPGSHLGHYGGAAALATTITLFSSVLIPNALTRHAGDAIVGLFARPLQWVRIVLSPVSKLMHLIDAVVSKAAGANGPGKPAQMEQEIQQEILSVVEEGEKEGVVDEEEREMIESVIQFRATTAGQIMTPRPEIVSLPVSASLAQVKQTLEESGNSRLPIHQGTLDQIVGILYARDLIRLVGQPPEAFNLKSLLRPPYYVPEVKPLRDLLDDFRLQKVHIAIVSDEYGGTAGLVTIEDILEELVGDISDEHEPVEPAMFKRIDEQTMEADARIYVDELNRLAGLNLPEDAGYDTLSGFVTTTLGKIPQTGTVFENSGTKFTVLDAEPQKVNRLKIELLPEPAEAGELAEAKGAAGAA